VLVRQASAYPTPPRPKSAAREPGAAHTWRIWSSVVPRSTKSASRANGITMSGGGGVSSRSEVGHLLVLACLDPLRPRAVPQLTRCLVERSIHVAVNDASLESSVCVAERNFGGHDTVLVALKQWCLRSSACWSSAGLSLAVRVAEASRPPKLPRHSGTTTSSCFKPTVYKRWPQIWQLHSAR
jgi:hypothetical protein